MEKVYTIVLCIFAFMEVAGQSIENDRQCINQIDSLGRSDGFWLDGSCLVYYVNGVMNGPAIQFEKNEEDSSVFIRSECIFRDGMPVSMTFYYPNGVVNQIVANFMPNTDFIGAQKMYTQESVFPYQAYCYYFYPDGKLKAKGWGIIGEDYVIDDERVGVWQYYTPDGTEEIVDYSRDDIDYKKYGRCL